MNAGGDDRAIRKGIEAVERWPDFARDSMAAQFDAVRHIGVRTPMPPLVPEDSAWCVLNAILSEAEQQSREMERSLAARAIDDACWFGVPVPPDVATLASRAKRRTNAVYPSVHRPAGPGGDYEGRGES